MLELKSNGRTEHLAAGLLRLWSRVSSTLQAKWSAGSLSRQFLITATLIVSIAMFTLGSWMSERAQGSATRSAAEAGAIFLQAFLQPYVQELALPEPPSKQMETRLNTLFENTLFSDRDLRKRFILLKIWRLDGTLAYSSSTRIKKGEEAEVEVRTAARGELATGFEDIDDLLEGVPEEEAHVKLLEVYAPLYQMQSDRVIAVGEFYQSAAALIDERTKARNSTWLLVGTTSFAMVAVLHLIVSRGSRIIDLQRDDLKRRYAEAARLAEQNNELRKTAERARIRASEDSENFLAGLGSELHDGPLQTLSILMLSLQYGRDGQEDHEPIETTRDEGGPPDSIRLARFLYSELRNISSGLVLPGIQDEGLAETIEAAIRRHEQLTGTAVEREVGNLPSTVPTAVKICCYRVIQEGLNNAYRHASAVGQSVTAREDHAKLTIIVGDRGPGVSEARHDGGRGPGLGLVGLQNRVAALSGTLSIRSRADGGTELQVKLPLDLENPQQLS
ncbi:ATP-binding protein [Rhizobium sp. RCAM05973]|uniref:sensor histidine kinase n=1 Tax=Rhizobium sp. RCAM05973 TaxID=2994066 RepID=UPI0022EBBA3B|nr:ATP-binding protein [Rhizobium sp. RCAM05973]